MKKTKLKVLATVLLAGVLMVGTTTAFAGSMERSIGGITFIASTSAGPTSAYAQTYTQNSALSTSVIATYSYVDFVEYKMYTASDAASAQGTSLVRFNVPDSSRHEVYDITATHNAWTDNEIWSGTTSDKY